MYKCKITLTKVLFCAVIVLFLFALWPKKKEGFIDLQNFGGIVLFTNIDVKKSCNSGCRKIRDTFAELMNRNIPNCREIDVDTLEQEVIESLNIDVNNLPVVMGIKKGRSFPYTGKMKASELYSYMMDVSNSPTVDYITPYQGKYKNPFP